MGNVNARVWVINFTNPVETTHGTPTLSLLLIKPSHHCLAAVWYGAPSLQA